MRLARPPNLVKLFLISIILIAGAMTAFASPSDYATTVTPMNTATGSWIESPATIAYENGTNGIGQGAGLQFQMTEADATLTHKSTVVEVREADATLPPEKMVVWVNEEADATCTTEFVYQVNEDATLTQSNPVLVSFQSDRSEKMATQVVNCASVEASIDTKIGSVLCLDHAYYSIDTMIESSAANMAAMWMKSNTATDAYIDESAHGPPGNMTQQSQIADATSDAFPGGRFGDRLMDVNVA